VVVRGDAERYRAGLPARRGKLTPVGRSVPHVGGDCPALCCQPSKHPGKSCLIVAGERWLLCGVPKVEVWCGLGGVASTSSNRALLCHFSATSSVLHLPNALPGRRATTVRTSRVRSDRGPDSDRRCCNRMIRFNEWFFTKLSLLEQVPKQFHCGWPASRNNRGALKRGPYRP
jgi:hypothetical protein